MEFQLTIDLDRLTGDANQELARILRYWAGAVKTTSLEAGAKTNIYDSSYHKVGKWLIVNPEASE